MCFKIATNSMSHVVKNNPNPFTPGKSKSGNQITVACDNHNKIHHFTESQPGNVHSDP